MITLSSPPSSPHTLPPHGFRYRHLKSRQFVGKSGVGVHIIIIIIILDRHWGVCVCAYVCVP